MPKLRVESFTISLDGFGAGLDQDLNNPLGIGGTALHGWAIPTKTFQKNLFGNDSGETGGGKDVRVGGGVNTIQQYLRLGLIDEMHIAISPVLLGAGERLFEGVDLPALGYACTQHVASARATHIVLSKQ